MSEEKKCCNRTCCAWASVIGGGILVILGAFLVLIYNSAYDTIVENNLVIADGTESFEAWKVPPPLYLEFYLFNCTNPEEFLAGAEQKKFVKPVFEQLGPYVYDEYLEKIDTEFIDTPDTNEELKYISTGKYYFNAERSRGKESDMITTVNLIAAGVPPIVEYAFEIGGDRISTVQKAAIRRSLNLMMRDAGSKLLFQKTAGELFFGFQDDLLSAIVNTLELVPGVPDNLPNEFGLFQTMNTSAGWLEYKIYTGKEDYRIMNVVAEYEGMRELDYWFGKECNMINGTDGTTVEAFMKKDRRVYFFVDDLCRSLYADFYREVDIKRIPGYEYRVPAELFQAPVNNPDNECWCPDLSLEVCKYDGGLPLSTCLAGAPVFMTSPNFLYAPHYLNYVEGLKPIEEEHATPLVYEPSTGICLKADKRLQINMYMQPSPYYDILDGTFAEPYAFPVLWLNESYITSDEDADSAYKLLVVPAQVFLILQIIFCIVGSVLVLGGAYYLISKRLNKSAKVQDSDSIKSNKKAHEAYGNPAMKMDDKDDGSHVYSTIGKGSESKVLEGSTSSAETPMTAL